jgi:hypothetical protein
MDRFEAFVSGELSEWDLRLREQEELEAAQAECRQALARDIAEFVQGFAVPERRVLQLVKGEVKLLLN